MTKPQSSPVVNSFLDSLLKEENIEVKPKTFEQELQELNDIIEIEENFIDNPDLRDDYEAYVNGIIPTEENKDESE